MSFTISGLDVDQFKPLFELSNAQLLAQGVVRKTVDYKPGYPCRITLEDAEPGESVLLLNYESHKTASPYRSSYAIFVRENAAAAASMQDEAPGVLAGRPIALRVFNEDGMLIDARLHSKGEITEVIADIFNNDHAAYIHAHNAAHGCFVAEINRAA